MPPPDRVAAVFELTLQPRDPLPIVRGWNRLEGRPRSADFERSLRAEVRDPLWFLTRQWQYGEFEGEDAGSPIDARVAYSSVEFDSFSAGGDSLPYDRDTPLEVRVEREPVPFDLMLHTQASGAFERLLGARGLGAQFARYVAAFPLDYGTGVAGAHTDEARALFDTGRRFLFDTRRLVESVRNGTHEATLAGFDHLTPDGVSGLLAAGHALVAWFDQTYGQPGPEPTAWRREHLDYRFTCGAGGGQIQFAADGHRGGDLDWHAFDASAVAPAAGTPLSSSLSFLPVGLRFAGMPCARYWEMEDRRVDFGRLDANPNDLARLLLAEFMLLYSNDWCVLPLELTTGTFTRLDGLIVTDVFGDRTLIGPADRGADSEWQRWSMFRLQGDDAARMGLLLAPTLMATVESPPIERVEFLRDEMANMVWAVEDRVASKLGEAINPEVALEIPSPTPSAGAHVHYTLGTPVRSNWRPFVPARVPGSTRAIRLQRARLPGRPQESLGEVLNVPAPYYIAEEEVPRAGRTVTRSFHRARWFDGTTFLWIGRASATGRGEGASGLAFDRLEEIPPPG